MLVLSRRPGETIRFPKLGVSVSIVSAQGQRIRVGIDAPPEIHIVRGELLEGESETSTRAVAERQAPTPRKDSREVHDLKNRLNTAMLGLFLAQKQLAKGEPEVADQTLSAALQRLAELERNAAAYPVTPAAPAHEHRGQPSSARHTAGSGAGVDVLLVEDDLNEQALLRGLLEMEGYTVAVASNGVEALRSLSATRPRFVLLDMAMPECDGPETLRQIRANAKLQDLTVFAVSGSTPATVGLPSGPAGVADWFAKPLDPRRLVEHLRHAV